MKYTFTVITSKMMNENIFNPKKSFVKDDLKGCG